jgi:hypothetical protein
VNRIVRLVLTLCFYYQDFLNIDNKCGELLNNLQIRLLRQLLAEEFQELRGFAKMGNAFYQIQKRDKQKDDEYWAKRLKTRQKVVVEQLGLSFVIRALSGGTFAQDVKEKGGLTPAKRDQIDADEEKLQQRAPILVVHNSLADLLFLYHTFIGAIAPDIETFVKDTSSLFARIVDTKYILDFGSTSMSTMYNLEQWYEEVKYEKGKSWNRTLPALRPAEPEFGYLPQAKRKAHSAGFDSM